MSRPSTVGTAEDLKGHTPTCSFYRGNRGPIKSKVTPGSKPSLTNLPSGKASGKGKAWRDVLLEGGWALPAREAGEPGRDSTSRASGGGGDSLRPPAVPGPPGAARSECHRHMAGASGHLVLSGAGRLAPGMLCLPPSQAGGAGRSPEPHPSPGWGVPSCLYIRPCTGRPQDRPHTSLCGVDQP